MLSLGTELFFAFWMASYRVGLPSGSPPPVRAATSMFLMSLANILPRRASMTAFLCLVVAHLECPLIDFPSQSSPAHPQRRRPILPTPAHRSAHHLAEQPVHPQVSGQLRVERGGQHDTLAHRDDPTGGRPLPWDA